MYKRYLKLKVKKAEIKRKKEMDKMAKQMDKNKRFGGGARRSTKSNSTIIPPVKPISKEPT